MTEKIYEFDAEIKKHEKLDAAVIIRKITSPASWKSPGISAIAGLKPGIKNIL